MKNLLFILLTTSLFIFSSCGDSNSSIEEREPIEVSSEEWYDIMISHTENANEKFESIIEAEETDLDANGFSNKIDEVTAEINDMIAEVNAHQITGTNAEKLEEPANITKTAAIEYFQAIIDYCNIAKENADLLIKSDWTDAEDKQFEKTILPIEDKIYEKQDAFGAALSDFHEAKDAL